MSEFKGFGFHGGNKQTQKQTAPTLKPVVQTQEAAKNNPQKQQKEIVLQDGNTEYKLWKETGNIGHLKKAAELGDCVAQNELGYQYYRGEKLEKNDELALQWHERSAKQGFDVAIYNVGCIYQNGYGVKIDYDKAEEYFKKASELGYEEADAALKALPRKREFQLWNETGDISHLQKAAELGHRGAQNDLAMEYFTGKKVEQNYALYIQWLERAAQQGNELSLCNLGFAYTYGYGVDLDLEKAEELFKKAESMGYEQATENLRALERIKTEGFMKTEILTLAKQGDGQAQNILGVHYLGINDLANAKKWLLAAGKNGNFEGYFNLGQKYLHEGNYDEAQAKEYFRKAAELKEPEIYLEEALDAMNSGEYKKQIMAYGYYLCGIDHEEPTAYYMMGQIYENGLCGEEADIEKALTYYEKAYDGGIEEAEEEIDKLSLLRRTKNLESDMENSEKVALAEQEEEKELPENLDSYFEGLIGMDSVKEQLNKIYHSVKLNIMRNRILTEKGEKPIANESGYNFIILGNPGTGKTMVARIIAQILRDIQIRETDIFLEVDRSRMLSEHIGGTEKKMQSIFRQVQGGTLFVDEAHNLYKEGTDNDFGQEAIDALLKEMEDNRDSFSVILAGYKTRLLEMMKNANSGFRSRFSYMIELPDYTDEELIEIANMHMANQQYQPEEGTSEAIRKCISRDKIDDTFGNARYIRELVKQAIENQSQRLHESKDFQEKDLFTLKAEDFWKGELEEKSTAEYLDELDALVGLQQVKEEVRSLIDRITLQTELEKRGVKSSSNLGTLHMAFKGNPGTGKTTVARLLGNLYSSLGILKRKGVFVECTRATLIGQYQGHTAANVKKVVQSALGGILFIDEAYALVKGEGDSFGKEAVDTLVAEMENYRDRLIVIFAGYSKDMDEFFKNNEGLRSRVPIDLFFEDYSQEEMLQIARIMLEEEGYILDEEVLQSLKKMIEQESLEKGFGNARGIRNLTDSIKRKQNRRIVKLLRENGNQVEDHMLMIITSEDCQ